MSTMLLGNIGSPPLVGGSFSLTNTPQQFISGPARRFKANLPSNVESTDSLGRRLRKGLGQVRRTIDYSSTILNFLEARLWQKGQRQKPFLQPDILYSADVLPPFYDREKPIDCVTTKFLRSAMNKVKCPIYSICWTPEGRRLLTGASSGEFTLWNGVAFNFETILQAHDVAVRAMVWSHSDQWMVTADHDGYIKYWQANMNNVKMFQAHKEAIRSLSFCPTDTKFATASDDGTVRVWDFLRCHEERILRGHGSDVRSIHWHPQKALLVSGSRDSQQPVKLWDPKSGQSLATLHDHKNGVMDVKWNDNGNWLISASRDHLIKLFDIRMMKEMQTFRGHKKEVTSLAWNPIHEGLLVSGGGDGAIMFWLVGNEKEVGVMENAHEQAIWTMAWHPLGHLLASGSNDNNTKFWTRNKPGDTLEDFYGMGSTVAGMGSQFEPTVAETAAPQMVAKMAALARQDESLHKEEDASIPGMGLEEDVLQKMRNSQFNPRFPGFDANQNFRAKNTPRAALAKKEQQQHFERAWSLQKPLLDTPSNQPPPQGFNVNMRMPPGPRGPQGGFQQRPPPGPGFGFGPNQPGGPLPRGPGNPFGMGGPSQNNFGPPPFGNFGPGGPPPPNFQPGPGFLPQNFAMSGQRPPSQQNFNAQHSDVQQHLKQQAFAQQQHFRPSGANLTSQHADVSATQRRAESQQGDSQLLQQQHGDPRLAAQDVDYRRIGAKSSSDINLSTAFDQAGGTSERGDRDYRQPASASNWTQQGVADEDLRSRDPRARANWPESSDANGSRETGGQGWSSNQFGDEQQDDAERGNSDDSNASSHLNPKRKWQQEYEAMQHDTKRFAGNKDMDETVTEDRNSGRGSFRGRSRGQGRL